MDRSRSALILVVELQQCPSLDGIVGNLKNSHSENLAQRPYGDVAAECNQDSGHMGCVLESVSPHKPSTLKTA